MAGGNLGKPKSRIEPFKKAKTFKRILSSSERAIAEAHKAANKNVK